MALRLAIGLQIIAYAYFLVAGLVLSFASDDVRMAYYGGPFGRIVPTIASGFALIFS